MTTLVKSFPFYKDINKIVHNGDNYINKFYNMIYLDVNNKVNIKKNKMKWNVQNIGIERRIGRRRNNLKIR